MGAPAVISGDKVIGQCAIHKIPSPSGSPILSPAPLPFAAPLLLGLTTTVMINKRPAAVENSAGLNTPPHPGLHPTDRFMVPTTQRGEVKKGSSTVFFEGKPAAYTGCQVISCNNLPATVTGTGTTVLVGS